MAPCCNMAPLIASEVRTHYHSHYRYAPRCALAPRQPSYLILPQCLTKNSTIPYQLIVMWMQAVHSWCGTLAFVEGDTCTTCGRLGTRDPRNPSLAPTILQRRIVVRAGTGAFHTTTTGGRHTEAHAKSTERPWPAREVALQALPLVYLDR